MPISLKGSERRKARVRKAIKARANGRPRLSVHRSDKNIYAQIIDDASGKTLAAASSLDKDVKSAGKGGSSEGAAAVGKLIAERGKAAKIEEVVFDRGQPSPITAARQGAGRCRPRSRHQVLIARREKTMRDVQERDSEFVDRLVHINRVAKVVKGGKRFSFCCAGRRRRPEGPRRLRSRQGARGARGDPQATEQAKRQLIRVPLRDRTRRCIARASVGRHGAGQPVVLRAVPGTGIIAGGPMRAVFETLGVNDIVAKSIGTSNPYNMVRATFDALKKVDSPRSVAARRGLGFRTSRPVAARNRWRRKWPTRWSPSSSAQAQRGGRPIRRATLVGLGLNKIRKQRQRSRTRRKCVV